MNKNFEQNLLSLSVDVLNKIASDISIDVNLTSQEKAKLIKRYYKDFGFSWEDVKSRYEIP